MDIASIIPERPLFTLATDALGEVSVWRLTMGLMKKLDFKAENEPFIASLLKAICRTSGDEELSDEQVAMITPQERERFAELYLNCKQHLYRERISQVKDTAEGRTVSVSEGEIKHEREPEETATAYLHRLFRLQFEGIAASNRKILEAASGISELNRKLFSPGMIDALKGARSASAQLGDTLKSLKGFEEGRLPSVLDVTDAVQVRPIPPEFADIKNLVNPAHETNHRLSEVSEHLDGLRALAVDVGKTVQAVSDAATQFLVDFRIASSSADKTSKRAIRMAALAILATFVATGAQIGYSVWQTWQDQISQTQAMEQLSRQIETIIATERDNGKQLRESQYRENKEFLEKLQALSVSINQLTTELKEQQAPANSEPANEYP